MAHISYQWKIWCDRTINWLFALLSKYVWQTKSPGMLRHVTQYTGADICEEFSAFIFWGYTVYTLNNGLAWECLYLCPCDQVKDRNHTANVNTSWVVLEFPIFTWWWSNSEKHDSPQNINLGLRTMVTSSYTPYIASVDFIRSKQTHAMDLRSQTYLH